MEKKGDGNLPVLHVSGRSIPEVWENSVIELYDKGLWYHRGGHKDKGRLQVDSTMTMEIAEPGSEFYHKYMTCSWEDLLEYQMEMLGAKDSWVDPTGNSTKWQYHYHERMAVHPGLKGCINQLEEMLRNLKERPNTRQAQAITWVPERDTHSRDPPCLQSVWIALIPNEESGNWRLNMNYRFRSRNVMIAAPMNQFGLATFQECIRRQSSERMEEEIETGRMVDMVDSYHVSAQDQHLLRGFIERLNKSKEKAETIRNRMYDRQFSMTMMAESHTKIEEKIIEMTREQLAQKKFSPADIEKEITKIRQISHEVSEINGY